MSVFSEAPLLPGFHPAVLPSRIVHDDCLPPYHPLAQPAPAAAPTAPGLLGGMIGGFSSVMDLGNDIRDRIGDMRQLNGLATMAVAPGATSSVLNRVLGSGPVNGLLTSSPLQNVLGSKPVTALEDNEKVGGVFDALSAGSQLLTAGSELADPKQRTQGVMDGVAGALSTAALVNPELAPVATLAGFAATGNETTKNLGLWGQDATGENKDSVQWTMDNTANAWNWGRSVGAGTGSRVLTDVFGAGAGLVTGIGSGLVAGAADIGAGAIQTGVDSVTTLANAAGNVAHFGGELVTNPGQAVNDAVNFGSSVVTTAGNVATTAASDVMGIVSNPGQAVQNAAGIAGNVVNGAANVAGGALNVAGQIGGGIVQGAQALGSDAMTDAGNLLGGICSLF